MEQGLQKLGSPWEFHEDIGGGERNVEEEGTFPLKTHSGKFGRERNEVVVVDPDEVFFLRVADKCARIFPVHFKVGFPIRGVEAATGLKIVKKGPDDFIGKPVIKEVPILLRQEHGEKPKPAFTRKGIKDLLDFLNREFFGHSGPTDPKAPAVLQDGAQGGNKAAGAFLHP
jgi:hypothetical protein